MKKTLLVIPGFGESTKEEQYKKLISLAKKDFDKIIEVNPVWNHRTVTHWYQDVLKSLSGVNPENITAVGFSLGAYILILLSEHMNFNKTLLCSLSPFFKEQLSKMPEGAQDFFGKRRVKDFHKHHLPKKTQSSQTIFLFGTEDWVYAINQSEILAKVFKSEFVRIPGTGHELTDDYIEEIIKKIK